MEVDEGERLEVDEGQSLEVAEGPRLEVPLHRLAGVPWAFAPAKPMDYQCMRIETWHLCHACRRRGHCLR